MKKPFKRVLLTGRYQSLQVGHVNNFKLASELAHEVFIFVGSAQEKDTIRNPFSIEFRISAIKEAILELGLTNVTVIALNDMTNENDICFDWGKWVLKHFKDASGADKPDLIIHGDDGRDNDPILWFDEEDKVDIHFLMVPRNEKSVSGTYQRETLAFGDYPRWAQDSPKSLHRHFQYMHGHLLTISYYVERRATLRAEQIQRLINNAKPLSDLIGDERK